ncbi:MAG TPA: hypothetical protein VFU68_01220 [Terracidiphilus sp.]|nr:hypothetical protein [Terracidiphilus sp.]
MNGYQAAYEAAKQERAEIRATIEKLLSRSEVLGNVLESLTPVLIDDHDLPGAEVEMFPVPVQETQTQIPA